MLILFIDGPWEGKSLNDQNPQRQYDLPVYEPSVVERSKKVATPLATAVYREVHRYQSPAGKTVLLYSSE